MADTKRQDFSAGPRQNGLVALLDRAESLVAHGVDAQSPIPGRLADLRARLAQQRLQLAVLGQFKRGKSSFVNALLGAPLLPFAVVPLTAIPTFIAWGADPMVRISFGAGREPLEKNSPEPRELRDFLFGFVAEDANPSNHLNVVKTELFYPSPILAGGTVLIDTPGIGSTHKHNTEAALRVMPECDAGLFVVSTDPPLTEIELEYLEQLRSKVSRLFIVLNKIDTVPAEEREVLVNFLRKVLHGRSLPVDDDAIFKVSARDGLAAKLAKNPAAVERSGIATIEERLLGFLAAEKLQSLEQAIGTKTVGVLEQAADEVDLRLQGLKMPLAQLEAKTAAFESVLRGIEEQRRITADLLAGDKRRLVASLEDRIEALRDKTRTALRSVIDASLTGTDPSRWETAAREKVAATIESSFEAARAELAQTCAVDANAVLARFQSRIDELIAAVRRNAAEIFETAFREDIDRDSYGLGEDPYWVTQDIAASLIPDPSRLIDRILPAGLRRKRLGMRLNQDAEQLIVRNAENLRWALLRGFDETFRKASVHLEERLDDAIETTRRVIERVLSDRRDRSFASEPEIDRLATSLGSLAELRRAIGDLAHAEEIGRPSMPKLA